MSDEVCPGTGGRFGPAVHSTLLKYGSLKFPSLQERSLRLIAPAIQLQWNLDVEG